MLSRWIYILIGNDNTGKTTFQKEILKILCDENRDSKLDSAKKYDIKHPYALKKGNTLFLSNRSYQEKKNSKIKSVKDYFEYLFSQADICILSSHLNIDDIKEKIYLGKKQFYNIGGVFWANSIEQSLKKNEEIALLDWDEKFIINNSLIFRSNKSDDEFRVQVNNQIKLLSYEFAQMLINRMNTQ